jgi:hypothetical protein
VKSSARIVGPEAARRGQATAALTNARRGQRTRGVKGFIARTLNFGGLARSDLGEAEVTVTAPSTTTLRKRRRGGENSVACAPADPRVCSLRAPAKSKSLVDKNLAFLRDCTGDVSGGPSRLCPAFGPDYRGWLSGGFEAGLRLSGLRIGPLGLSSRLPIWGFQPSFHPLL